MNWSEDLPESCPPSDAFSSDGSNLYYRLIKDESPKENDFHSHRKLWPNQIFNATECIARSLSIYNNKSACLDLIKLPAIRTKGLKNIVELNLKITDGLLKKTGKDQFHYSWWRSDSFTISSCIVITKSDE